MIILSMSAPIEVFSCAKCSKQFSYKKNLVRHERNNTCVLSKSKVQDDEAKRKRESSIKCAECQLVFSCRDLFVNHAKNEHELNLDVEELTFETYTDFKKWKTDVESDTLSRYHTRSTVEMKGVKRMYLDCHRSGFFSSRSKNIRRIKSQGTNKINSICTSFMKVVQYPDKVEVKFQKTHFGHGSNLY